MMTQRKSRADGTMRRITLGAIRATIALSVSMSNVQLGVSTLTTKLPRKQLVMPRLCMRVGGKPRKAPTELRSNYFQMFVMVKMSEMLLRQLPLTLSIALKPGMVIIIWMLDPPGWLAGYNGLVWLLGGARHMSALRMSHRFTCGSRVSHLSGTCRVFVSVLCLVGFCVVLFPPFFASGRGFLTQFLPIVLDDRQCFTARSAAR